MPFRKPVSIDNITLPFRFIVPILFAILFFVYQKDQATAAKDREELRQTINSNMKAITLSMKESKDDQRLFLNNYQEFKDQINQRMTIVEYGCCHKS